MRAAMASAVVGDDVFGEDPTVNQLESEGAAALGQRLPCSCRPGRWRTVAIHVHCRPGDELICEERSHVYMFEGGSAARLSGTQVRPLRADDGFPAPEAVRTAVRANDVHQAGVACSSSRTRTTSPAAA